MSILVNKDDRVLIQGITGHEGLFHAELMINYGTKVVAGVTPGKGGEWVLGEKIPIFDTVKDARDVTEAECSVIFVPAKSALDAMLESICAGIKLIVCITEGIPVQDMMRIKRIQKGTESQIIGPNCPGIISPGQTKLGIIPGDITIPGNIGVISRSGTLTYEVLNTLKIKGLGVSTCVGIGGDPITGTNFIDILDLFEQDPFTEKIVLIGEIGGQEEEKAAEFILNEMTKPVVAFIAGQTAPRGKRMGHAGAIIEGRAGTAKDKIQKLMDARIKVAKHPEEIPALLR